MQILDSLRIDAQLRMAHGVSWWAAQRGDHPSRLLHWPWRHNPYPTYARMRAQAPLVHSRLPFGAVATHSALRTVLRDRDFLVRAPEGKVPPGQFNTVDLSFLQQDPPDHTRLRKLAQPAFSPKRMAEYRPEVEKITGELLDTALARGKFDLMRDFAQPLPIMVISRLLGVPESDHAEFVRIGYTLGGALDGAQSARQLRRIHGAAAELDELFERLLADRRANPRDDVVSTLVAESEAGSLTSGELRLVCRLLLLAGFETTVNLIGNGTMALLRYREQWEQLVADPGLAAGAVEECLRFDAPVQLTGRWAGKDTEVEGVPVRRGTQLMCLIGSANRDPERFTDPDRFDITRTNAGEHLAFSSGAHYCLGAPLARLEGEIALRALAERAPKLRPTAMPTRRNTLVVRALTDFPVISGPG